MSEQQSSAVSAQPVAWIVISEETNNTRIWWRDKERADAWCAKHDKTAIALYAAPPSTHTEPQAAPSDALAELEQQFMHVLDGWEEDSSSPAAISALQYALGAVRDAAHRSRSQAESAK
jgi:hypothetical protein